MNKLRILVAENDARVACELSRQLDEIGYESAGQADTGEKVIALTEQLRPNLVLMDIHLPGAFNGIAAAQVIQERLAVPVIFIASHPEKSIPDQTQADQPSSYLSIPFRSNELKMVVDLTISKHQVEIQLRQINKENKHREDLTLLHDLVETSQDLIWQCDAIGRYTYLNPAWEEVFGYQIDEMLGRQFSDFQAPNYAERDKSEFRRLLKGGIVKGYETVHRAKDGRALHLVFNAKYLTDLHGDVIGTRGTAYDITARKQAEEAISSKSEFNRLVIENVGQGICVCHAIQEFPYVHFTIWNKCMTLITGYSEEEINRLGWYQSMYPDPAIQERAIARMQRMRLGDNLQDEEWEITRADGRKRQLLITSCLHTDSKGGTYVLAVMNDITERKQAEAEKDKLEVQNRQLQKSESLSRMAGAIAHQFNNQLQAVVLNLEMAQNDLPQNTGTIEKLIEAKDATYKAAEVSNQMLAYLGQTSTKQEPLDLADTCRRRLPVLQAVVPKKVVFEADLPSPGPIIRCDANQILQVVTNLVTNAWEACSDGQGAIRLAVKTVSTADIPAENRFPIDWQPLESAYVCLEVTDTGCGIADHDIEKIFDPFYSRKFIGRGMGLSVALGIVRAYNGAIAVRSELGQGSVFRAFFPGLADAVHQKPLHAAQAPKTTLGGTVLVVDDEPALRKVVVNALERFGFTTFVAEDGIKAVEVFRHHQNEIQCVLCDLTMPRMDGWKTMAALRQLAPKIPVILSSGYNQDQVMACSHSEQPQMFLKKPYVYEELISAINQVLDYPKDSSD